MRVRKIAGVVEISLDSVETQRNWLSSEITSSVAKRTKTVVGRVLIAKCTIEISTKSNALRFESKLAD